MRGGVSDRDIQERLRMPLKSRIPDDQPLATHSINRGVPLVTSHRRSALTRAIRALARQLIEELEVQPQDVGLRRGLTGRWAGRRGARAM
jgi:hypothetical protein